MSQLADPSRPQDAAANAHAARVLETRNQAFRVLYDTVLEAENAPEEQIYGILARNLRRICRARGVVLCSCNAAESTIRPRARAWEIDEISGADQPPDVAPTALPRAAVEKLIQNPILPFSEVSADLKAVLDWSGAESAATDDAAAYCVSCAREGELLSLGFVCLEPGAKLKLKDVIRTYLNFMGLVLQRIAVTRALRDSETFVKSILDSMKVGILVVDPKTHKILEVNSAAAELIGAGRERIVGEVCYGFVCGAKPGRCPITDLGRSTDLSERFMHTVDGEKIAVLKGVVPVTRGDQTYLIESFTDIRERLRTEKELHRAKEAAEDASRTKSEFLANMSHEIRTPMTAILGFTDTLLERDLSESERANAVQIIRRNGEHLLTIINDILDISKLEAGKVEIERAWCNPVEIVQEVCLLMQVRAEAKGLRLELEYKGLIPEMILTDATRLRQILVNLIGNAIKFTLAGAVRVVIQREAGARRCGCAPSFEDLLSFQVIDTGIGMTAEQIERLFRPFEQADTSTSRQFGGTGLGLMISKRLAAMLGGDITVESEIGRGSVFHVSIQAGNCDEVALIEPKPCQERVVASERPSVRLFDQTDLAGLRLLLAEDGPDNQRLIAHLLRKAGAEVSIVENGQLAVDAIEEGMKCGRVFQIVLMDMQMPVMDGYTATRLLRSRGYSGKVIALTAHAMARDRAKCLDCGCDEYVSKPIDRRVLIETIQRLASPSSSAASEPSAACQESP